MITDDVDGSPGAEAVSFGLDGVSYEIDLAPLNKTRLADAVAPYIAARRRVSRRARSAGRPVAARVDRGAVRAWASDGGLAVSARRDARPGGVPGWPVRPAGEALLGGQPRLADRLPAGETRSPGRFRTCGSARRSSWMSIAGEPTSSAGSQRRSGSCRWSRCSARCPGWV